MKNHNNLIYKIYIYIYYMISTRIDHLNGIISSLHQQELSIKSLDSIIYYFQLEMAYI